MSFEVPQMPLAVAVYSGPWAARSHRFDTVGNLAHGRRVFQNPLGDDPQLFIATVTTVLLLPAGTDVRDMSTGVTTPDVVEVPAGSGRWYGVEVVDDLGKGFPNEHRFVLMTKIFQVLNGTNYPGLVWPTPIP